MKKNTEKENRFHVCYKTISAENTNIIVILGAFNTLDEARVAIADGDCGPDVYIWDVQEKEEITI